MTDNTVTYAENLKRIMANDKDGFMKSHPAHAAFTALMTPFGKVSDFDKVNAEGLAANNIGAFNAHCDSIRNSAMEVLCTVTPVKKD